MIQLAYILVGILIGVFSGLVGIGGGILLVPILVFFFHFSQHEAQGTSLAMLLPPIGLLTTWLYYQKGFVNLPVAFLLALGFVLGSFLGAKLSLTIPDTVLQKIFAVVLLIIAVKLLLGK